MIRIHNDERTENALGMLATQHSTLMLRTRTQSWYMVDGKVWLVYGPNVYRCDHGDENEELKAKIRQRAGFTAGTVSDMLQSAEQRYAVANQDGVTSDNAQQKLIDAYHVGFLYGQKIIAEIPDIEDVKLDLPIERMPKFGVAAV